MGPRLSDRGSDILVTTEVKVTGNNEHQVWKSLVCSRELVDSKEVLSALVYVVPCYVRSILLPKPFFENISRTFRNTATFAR